MLDGQDGFQYTDEELVTLDKCLSGQRLAGYYIHARSDKWVGIRLYERNTEISEALYGVLGALEITLRNAIHDLLTQQIGTAEWYDRIALSAQDKACINEAKRAIADAREVLDAGRVVAKLSFHFWVRLTSSDYERQLWLTYLSRIFPKQFAHNRGYVHARLMDLKTLRNRIAHHERITCGKRNPESDYASILGTIGWISPTARAWVESTNCFPRRLAKRIPRKPKLAQQVQAAAEIPKDA
jgi:hypothetical protein